MQYSTLGVKRHMGGMMRLLLMIPVFVLLINFLSGTAMAQSGVVKDAHVGCLTEEYLDQMTSALVNRDERLYSSLMGKVCVPIQGQQFSILDRGFITSKIRVYVGGDHIDLYVPSEATR